MSSDVLANFSCLDELTQVIYQGAERFALKEDGGTEVGLCCLGSKSSDKLLEVFAEKLAATFVQGDLYIGDWDSGKNAEIKLILGVSSKKPLHIPLVEIGPADAAAYAANVFLDIALQARSRKCRLHPDQFATPTVLSSVAADITTNYDVANAKSVAPKSTRASVADVKPRVDAGSSAERKAQDEIKTLKAELEKQKQRLSPGVKAKPAPKPLKGASLANPNKKARKYQAIEFESDEE